MICCRTFAIRKDSFVDKKPGAFSVLTLILNDLELSDTGSYTCQTTWGPDEDRNRTISLEVVQRGNMSNPLPEVFQKL